MKSPKAKAFELLIALAKRRSPEAKQDQQRFARCAAEFISLISVKETNQRKRCLSRANQGSHRRGDFSTRHPCLVEKRRTSMCGALRVCQPRAGIRILRSQEQDKGKCKAGSRGNSGLRPGNRCAAGVE